MPNYAILMNYLFIGPLLLDSFIVNLLHTELGVAAIVKSIGIMLQYNFLCGHSCLHAKTDLLTGKNARNVFNSNFKKNECVNPISKPFLLFGLTTCLETSWTWVLESLHCGRQRL